MSSGLEEKLRGEEIEIAREDERGRTARLCASLFCARKDGRAARAFSYRFCERRREDLNLNVRCTKLERCNRDESERRPAFLFLFGEAVA